MLSRFQTFPRERCHANQRRGTGATVRGKQALPQGAGARRRQRIEAYRQARQQELAVGLVSATVSLPTGGRSAYTSGCATAPAENPRQIYNGAIADPVDLRHMDCRSISSSASCRLTKVLQPHGATLQFAMSESCRGLVIGREWGPKVDVDRHCRHQFALRGSLYLDRRHQGRAMPQWIAPSKGRANVGAPGEAARQFR